MRDELRAIRFALEYAKAELLLRDWGIRSTIIVFGGARMPSPERVEAARAAKSQDLARLERQVVYYNAAREFARIASERGGALAPHDRKRDNVIATGGGPGIMEAARHRAFEAGAPSIGFNIALPHEQEPNRYSTPALTFQFHYFAMRKMHFAMRANALVVFRGGFGTLDELFELLTLMQTEKMPIIPVVLVDRHYWTRVINFAALVEEGTIARSDLELFSYADDAEDAWRELIRRGLNTGPRPPGYP